MATFRLHLSDQYNANSKKFIELYRNGFLNILKNLQCELPESDAGLLERLDKNSDAYKKLFDDKYCDIQSYTRLWANLSTRSGASVLALDEHLEKSVKGDETTYKKLLEFLKEKRNEYRNNPDHVELFDKTIKDVEKWHQVNVLNYITRLKQATAHQLILKLHGFENDEVNSLKQALFDIYNLKRTLSVSETFNKRKKLHQLKNQLINFNKNHNKDEKETKEFSILSQQLILLANRELDDYYENPIIVEPFEKARKYIRGASSAIAILSGLGFVACLFIPGTQFLCPIFAIIASISYLSNVDALLFDIIRPLIYRTSPTKKAIVEFSISTGLTVLLAASAPIFIAIGKSIVAGSQSIAHGLIQTGNLIGNKLTNLFGAMQDTFDMVLTFVKLKQSNKMNAKKRLAEKNIVTIEEGISLLEEEDIFDKKYIANKGTINHVIVNNVSNDCVSNKDMQQTEDFFNETMDNHSNKLERRANLFCDKKKLQEQIREHEQVFIYYQNHTFFSMKPSNCDKIIGNVLKVIEKFSPVPQKKVKADVKALSRLPSNAPIEQRLEKVNQIELTIDKKLATDSTLAENMEIKELKQSLDTEKKILQDIPTLCSSEIYLTGRNGGTKTIPF